MQPIIMLFFIVFLYLFTKNVFSFVFSVGNYKIHKKRLKQLKFKNKQIDEDEVGELIDRITKPVIKNIIPKIKIKNLSEIEKDLQMAKWDKKITAIQFVALKIITKALGLFLFLILFKASKLMAIIWGIILFFSVQFLLNNSVNNRRDKLMMDFPDFIRITLGYLIAGMPFVHAVEESIKFVGEEWQLILRDFVVEAELNSVEVALEGIKNAIDIFEVKEFVALVRLTLEQGGNAKEGFESQAEKIQQMLYDVILLKINKRRMMGILIQAPLLLCNMAVFGLPTVHSMFNMGL